jgi:hypothetical protein
METSQMADEEWFGRAEARVNLWISSDLCPDLRLDLCRGDKDRDEGRDEDRDFFRSLSGSSSRSLSR